MSLRSFVWCICLVFFCPGVHLSNVIWCSSDLVFICLVFICPDVHLPSHLFVLCSFVMVFFYLCLVFICPGVNFSGVWSLFVLVFIWDSFVLVSICPVFIFCPVFICLSVHLSWCLFGVYLSWCSFVLCSCCTGIHLSRCSSIWCSFVLVFICLMFFCPGFSCVHVGSLLVWWSAVPRSPFLFIMIFNSPSVFP